MLVDKAPDEILSGIGDHEKREELLQHQLRKETPIGVRYLLAAVWDIPKLKELVKELTEQIGEDRAKGVHPSTRDSGAGQHLADWSVWMGPGIGNGARPQIFLKPVGAGAGLQPGREGEFGGRNRSKYLD